MHMQAGLPAGDPEVAVSLKQRHAHFAINQLMVDDLCAPPVTCHIGGGGRGGGGRRQRCVIRRLLNAIRRELFVDRRRARQRSSRLLLRKGNVFKLLVPPS